MYWDKKRPIGLPFELILFVHFSIVDFSRISIAIRPVVDDFEVLLVWLRPEAEHLVRFKRWIKKKQNPHSLRLNNHLILSVVLFVHLD